MTSSTKNDSVVSIVIDSNVWISALVFGGKPRQVFERVVQENVRLLLSEEIVTEVIRNLKRKFPGFDIDFETLILGLERNIVWVRLGAVTITVSRDPDDNRVLETAVIGHASVVVSGDKDLLSLGRYQDIAIITPAEFIEIV